MWAMSERFEYNESTLESKKNNEVQKVINESKNSLLETLSSAEQLDSKWILKQLKSLGIEWNTKPNWAILSSDITKVDDIEKITTENIDTYLSLKDSFSWDKKQELVQLFKDFIKCHFLLYPGFKHPYEDKDSESFMNLSLDGIYKCDRDMLEKYQKLWEVFSKSEQKERAKAAIALNNKDLFSLYLQSEIISNQKPEREEEIKEIFSTIIPSKKVASWYKESPFIKSCIDSYLSNEEIQLKQKYFVAIDWEKWILDFSKKEEIDGYKKGIDSIRKLYKWTSFGTEFLQLYKQSEKVYEQIKKLNVPETIPAKWIATLNIAMQEFQEKSNQLESKMEWQDSEKAKDEYKTIVLEFAEKYAAVLFEDSTLKGKKITAPKEFWWFIIDLSKSTPKEAIKDGFWSNKQEQDTLFEDLWHNRKEYFWERSRICWVIGWYIAGTMLWCKPLWVSLWEIVWRVNAWTSLELLNCYTWIFEKLTGTKFEDNSRVETFWKSFLEWVWILKKEKDEYGNVIWERYVTMSEFKNDITNNQEENKKMATKVSSTKVAGKTVDDLILKMAA